MNVVIIDSDNENVRNFQTYINKHFPQLKVIRVVSNILMKLDEVLNESKPDLVIMDIRFYESATILYLKKAHEFHKDIAFITYGQLKDLANLKNAKENGALDYTLKPVKPAELSRCLELFLQFKEKIDKKREESQKFEKIYNANIEHYENIFFESLIKGYMLNEAEIWNGFFYFNYSFDAKFTAMSIRIDHYRQILLTLDEKEKHLLALRISVVAINVLEKYKAKVKISEFNAICIILSGDFSIEDITEIAEEIKGKVLDEVEIRISIGIGHKYDNATEIATSYKEACAALRYRYFLGHNTIIPISYVEPMNYISYRYNNESETKLVYAAVVGEFENCINILGELVDSLRKCEPLPNNLLPKIIMSILISINRYASEKGVDIKNFFTVFFKPNEIYEIATIDDAQKYLATALEGFCGYVVETNEAYKLKVYEQAKLHVKQNYFEQYSIFSIAAKLSTTPEYLEKIFMQMEKKSLFDYLVNIRMNIAKEYLKDSVLEVDIIAVKVGYTDYRHFKSVFKQKENVYPLEYRKFIQKAINED